LVVSPGLRSISIYLICIGQSQFFQLTGAARAYFAQAGAQRPAMPGNVGEGERHGQL